MESKNTINAFDLNNLLYVPTSDAALGIQRQYRRHYPQKTRYAEGEELVFNVHGRNFVDLRNSSLEFTVNAEIGAVGVGTVGFGPGSVVNLIRRVRVIAPNGQEISRSEKANVLQYYLMKVKNGRHFRENVGTQIDYDTDYDFATGAIKTYNIPLRFIDPFFGTEQFLPPSLVENLRIEITFEKKEIAFIYNGIDTDLTSYQISDPSLMLDSYTMSPAATKVINQMDPLIYQYKSYHHTLSGIDSGSNALDVQLSHSVSTALECFVINRLNDDDIPPVNSFRSREIKEGDQQIWRIGQIRMPQQPLVKLSQWVNNFYQVNQQLGNQGMDNIDMDYDQFVTGLYGHPSVDLRRSKYFDTSGIEISNQRELICQLKLVDSVETTSDMFCCYVGRIVASNGSITIEN